MKKSIIIHFFILSLLVNNLYSQSTIKYPLAKKDNTIDNIFSKEISDPYRYFEDRTDSATIRWVDEQKKLTNIFHKKSGLSNLIYRDLYKLSFSKFNKEEIAKEERDNESYYLGQYTFNLYAEPEVYYKKGEKGEYKLLAKLRKFRYDKNDIVGFTYWQVNDEKTKIAFMVDHSGTERHEIFVFDLKRETLLTEKIENVRYGGVIWNGNGFYYTKNDQSTNDKLLSSSINQRLCYHQLGDDPKKDIVVFNNQDTTGANSLRFYKLNNDNWILSYPMQLKGSWYRAYATVVPNEDNLFFPKNFLVVPFDDKVSYGVHAILGDNIIITTNNGAPNFRILSASKNELNKLHEFILESNKVIASVNQLGSDKISVKYFSEGKFNVLILDNEGNVLKNFDFPAGTSVGGFSATEDDIYATYYINSFYFPSTGFRLNLSTLDSKPIGVRKIPFNFDDFKTKYISYKSKDGTDVNMYITYNKKIALNGKNPTLINGYGGYGHVITPYFSGQNIIWLSNGGILAVPNIRGGGAQGSEWSEAGRKHNKQNAIDDFIGAAQHLIENNYTNPELLAIEGGSHGGMLVAAAMTQRPDLYKSVISKAAPLDMIRFQNYTIGTATTNLNEFGDINDSIDFEYMYKYSPYHNLNELTKYPNLLLMTGDHDTRVPPFNSYKFLAKLQNLADPSSTFLVNITESSGHTGPDTKNDALKYKSLKYEFIFKTMGLKYQRLPAYKEH